MEGKKNIYRIFIDPEKEIESGIQMNSAVKHPANVRKFFGFSEEGKAIKMEFNDVQQNIIGVAIVPNEPIFRSDEDGEYYVEFYAEDIKNMAYHYGKNLSWNKLNFEHNQENMTSSGVMYLSYIIDRKNGLNPPDAFKEEPDGTWILGYHFFDKLEYEFVKDNFTGWSVEGNFILESKFKNQNKMSKKEKTLIEALKGLFSTEEVEAPIEAPVEVALNSATLTDGTVLVWDGDLEEGQTAIFVQLEEGDAPAPDGEHTLEDGTILTTEGGILTMIVEASGEEVSEDETPDEFSTAILEAFEKQSVKLKAIEDKFSKLVEEIEALKAGSATAPTKKKFERSGDYSHLSPKQKLIYNRIKN